MAQVLVDRFPADSVITGKDGFRNTAARALDQLGGPFWCADKLRCWRGIWVISCWLNALIAELEPADRSQGRQHPQARQFASESHRFKTNSNARLKVMPWLIGTPFLPISADTSSCSDKAYLT
jgi:hypothetical protein